MTVSRQTSPAAALSSSRPVRLIDLHISWLDQYIPDTGWSFLADDDATAMPERRERLTGYLGTTAAAVLVTPYPKATPEPLAVLSSLLARYEAEFCGRLLYGPVDLVRWADDAEGLTWGLLAVTGCAALPDGDDHLRMLWNRGVRLFQPATVGPPLSVVPGRLHDWLDRLASAPGREAGPRPGFDLAGLDLPSVSAALDWFEAASDRRRQMVPALTHGGVGDGECEPSLGVWPEVLLARLRAIGGTIGLSVGPPWHAGADGLARSLDRLAAMPYHGEEGPGGVALATDFLARADLAPGLASARLVVEWAVKALDFETSHALLYGNAQRFLAELAESASE